MSEKRYKLHQPTNIWGGVSSSPLQMWALNGMADGEIEIPQRGINGVVGGGHLGEVTVRGVVRRTWSQAHRDAPVSLKGRVGSEWLYREIDKVLGE